jgi:hypothetical protein
MNRNSNASTQGNLTWQVAPLNSNWRFAQAWQLCVLGDERAGLDQVNLEMHLGGHDQINMEAMSK